MQPPSHKLTDYELERAERIRRNREELARLTAGLALPTAAPAYRGGAGGAPTDASDAEAAAARRRAREEQRAEQLMLARRSLRARGMDPVEESAEEMALRLEWAAEEQRAAEERRKAREAALAEARARGEVTTKGGRPVTWIGGGGQDPAMLARMGVPELRTLFRDIFGQATASNNSAWLRKKLAEPAATEEGGARRAAQPRARDIGASIWLRGDEEGAPRGEGAAGEGGGAAGEGGAAPPRRWEPRAVFNTRRDPCLAEAAQFIRSRRPAPRADADAGAAATGAAAGAAAPPAAAGGTASRWGVKRLRTTLVAAAGDDQAGAGHGGLGAAASALAASTAATVTQQLDSAPTSDNEHDGAAMLLRPAGDLPKAVDGLGSLLGGGDGALLVDFPWASADAGPGAWDGAGALLA